jgi:hypothetical protein
VVEPVSVVTAFRVFGGILGGLGFFGGGGNQGPPILRGAALQRYVNRWSARHPEAFDPRAAVDVSAPPGVDITPRYNPDTGTIDRTIGNRRTLPPRPPPSADTISYRKGPRSRLGRLKKLKGLKNAPGLGTVLYLLSESVSQTAADDVISDAEYRRRFGKGPKLENIKVTASRIAYPRPLERIKVTAKRMPRIETLTPVKVTARTIPRHPAPAPTRSTLLKRYPVIGTLSRALLPYLVTGLMPRRDPLTVSIRDGVRSPPVPTPQPEPSAAGFGSFGSFTSAGVCECPPKRKGKKRRRTVCYSGTYTERASGLSKVKRRKIPCK